MTLFKYFYITLLLTLFAPSAYSLEVKGITPDKSPVYKTVGKAELKLHIFEPKGHKPSDKRPAIVFFFGGGWSSGSPSQFYPHCKYLASRGMVAMSAEYRVKSRNKTTEAECSRKPRRRHDRMRFETS